LAEYSGNLQRGWQGTRPFSDVVVNIPALNHTYRFGDFTLSPLEELQRELRVMMARYRTGDGTGASIVTPAQSCVQDSNQALFTALRIKASGALKEDEGNSIEINQGLFTSRYYRVTDNQLFPTSNPIEPHHTGSSSNQGTRLYVQ